MSGESVEFVPSGVIEVLPDWLVWPGEIHEATTRWWMENDAETATSCALVEGYGIRIESKEGL